MDLYTSLKRSDMARHGHPQAWARWHLPPSLEMLKSVFFCCKCCLKPQ